MHQRKIILQQKSHIHIIILQFSDVYTLLQKNTITYLQASIWKMKRLERSKILTPTCIAITLRGMSSRCCRVVKCHVRILIISSNVNSKIRRPSVTTCKHGQIKTVINYIQLRTMWLQCNEVYLNISLCDDYLSVIKTIIIYNNKKFSITYCYIELWVIERQRLWYTSQ